MNVSYLVVMCSFPGLSLVEQQAQEELDCANHLPVTGRKHHHCGSTGLRRYVVGCPLSQHGACCLGSFLVNEDQVPRTTHVFLLQHCPLVDRNETPILHRKSFINFDDLGTFFFNYTSINFMELSKLSVRRQGDTLYTEIKT